MVGQAQRELSNHDALVAFRAKLASDRIEREVAEFFDAHREAIDLVFKPIARKVAGELIRGLAAEREEKARIEALMRRRSPPVSQVVAGLNAKFAARAS